MAQRFQPALFGVVPWFESDRMHHLWFPRPELSLGKSGLGGLSEHDPQRRDLVHRLVGQSSLGLAPEVAGESRTGAYASLRRCTGLQKQGNG